VLMQSAGHFYCFNVESWAPAVTTGPIPTD
jgi:hypothetical protein